jgi:outer membrane lipoprotein-sorting protein
MRWMNLIGLLLVAAPAYGQENEAENLFKKMENKIRSAKALHLVFEGKATEEGEKGKFSGTFAFTGSKFRIALNWNVDKKTEKKLTVSDGKSTFSNFLKPTTLAQAPQDGDFDKALALLTRGGPTTFFSVCSFGPPNAQDFDLDNFLTVEDFKLGLKEKIADHDTQALEYVAFFGKDKEPVKFSVWIDTKTNLPVKQISVEQKDGKEVVRHEVNFTTFTIDGKVDAKAFELPQ